MNTTNMKPCILKTKFLGKLMVFFAVALLGFNANAFKLKTHVWISQQVINDLNDGCSTIPRDAGESCLTILINGVNREFLVDAQTTQAILANQAVYRMGNIGPDASPDVLAGQIVIHPGSQGNATKWGSDQWAYNLEQFIATLENRISNEVQAVQAAVAAIAGKHMQLTYAVPVFQAS